MALLNLSQICSSSPTLCLTNHSRHVTPPPDFPVWVPSTLSKKKVVVVMGATGTGKSKLAVDLALRFNGEVVNSDKMQVYAGLDVLTNKITDEERMGVPHHLLGVVADPDSDFTASEFRQQASVVTNLITCRGHLPIMAGGSNSYLKELVDGAGHAFRTNYQSCFLWVDVQLSVLRSFIGARVERMVDHGLIDEVTALFNPQIDYKRGIRRAIGVPEMDRYLRCEGILNNHQRARLLETVIEEIKENTFKLACRQLGKIHRMRKLHGWRIHRIDATEAFLNQGSMAEKAWNRLVATPSIDIVNDFLHGEMDENDHHVDDYVMKNMAKKNVIGART